MKKLKKPRFVNVKVNYIDEIDFITGNTLPDIKEKYEKCRVVYEDKNGLLYVERNNQIYVYDPNNPDIEIEYV